ncbi:hypothetical protein EZV62_009554 [Acer yangbiense]|uniref:Uncharacterized protein n=1 Tax=Acer yangbiense TaxID=1000413 RepID=A0A5C7I076_9ROSI|nr:hypothetical protein EZV62_009554 [Acer yangbiense]
MIAVSSSWPSSVPNKSEPVNGDFESLFLVLSAVKLAYCIVDYHSGLHLYSRHVTFIYLVMLEWNSRNYHAHQEKSENKRMIEQLLMQEIFSRFVKFQKDGYAKIWVMPRYGDADSVQWFEQENML